MLYVDDGELVFEIRRYHEKVLLLIFNQFSNFGMEMHIGCRPKPSKTECVLFPPPGFFKTLSHYYPKVDIDFSQITIRDNKENEKQKRQRYDKSYD